MALRFPVQQQGTASAAAMWAHYEEPARWSAWSPQIRGATLEGPFAAGTRGVVHAPLGLKVPFTILSVDAAARTWRWRVGAGPLTLTLEHGVRDGEAWAVLEGPAWLVLGYAFGAALALYNLAHVDRLQTDGALVGAGA
jgi:hypothetical protein